MSEKSGTGKKKEFDFEKALKRLEEIVEELENEKPSLGKALALFQEGKKLGKQCNRELTSLEQKVRKILEEENGNFTLEEFEQDNQEE